MKNIVLTGFMGTGKSETGRLLARRLGYLFVDCDDLIRRRTGMSIPEIFRIHGELWFRDMEASVVRDVAEGSNLVIATGGGVVLRQENMDCLRRRGIIVCLTASPETIARRTERDRERPLLQVGDSLHEIRRLLSERTPFYDRADISVCTDDRDPEDVAEEIMQRAGSLQNNARS